MIFLSINIIAIYFIYLHILHFIYTYLFYVYILDIVSICLWDTVLILRVCVCAQRENGEASCY